jgi:hypothetical protein
MLPPATARALAPTAGRAEPAAITAATQEAAPAAADAAFGVPSAPRERLLDSAATRAAIRQAAHAPLLVERAASANDQRIVAKSEKLTEDVRQSAKGDCLKGEFGGAGMGLLSLPFFVAAEVGGHCAR